MGTGNASKSGTSEERLDSWKEIAVYLRRHVRTARLWEKGEGLPVHRHHHYSRGSVYAFRSELDLWLDNRGSNPRTDKGRVMLAILPFLNLSGDPEQEYFSDGLTEEMITQLSRLHSTALGVIARTSAMLNKSKRKTTTQIARELGVDYILEGTVRRAGNRVRINARLVQVCDQTQLWAEGYEEELADIFALQHQVARNIAHSLEMELLSSHSAPTGRSTTMSPLAYEAYLKGRFHFNKRTEEGLKKAIDYFERAIQEDPSYARPYSGLADSCMLLGYYCVIHPCEAEARSKAAAFKAIELDQTSGEAHTSLAELQAWVEWDWIGAEKEYQCGIRLDSSYTTSYIWYAKYLAITVGYRQSMVQCQRALEIDPISPILNAWMAMISYYYGRYEETIDRCERALEVDSEYALAHWILGLMHEQCGRFDEAIQEIQRVSSLFRGSSLMTAELGRIYAAAGKKEKATRILSTLKKTASTTYVSSYHTASIFAALNQIDQAFDCLLDNQKERSAWYPELRTDPRMNNLRTNPRYDALLSTMRLSRVEL